MNLLQIEMQQKTGCKQHDNRSVKGKTRPPDDHSENRRNCCGVAGKDKQRHAERPCNTALDRIRKLLLKLIRSCDAADHDGQNEQRAYDAADRSDAFSVGSEQIAQGREAECDSRH